MKKKRMRRGTLLMLALALLLSGGCGRQPRPSDAAAAPTQAPQTQQQGEVKLISAKQAKEIMDTESGFVLLDVRTEEEFNEKHIPGALLIPDNEIEARAEAELPEKSQRILVYCRSGRRSAIAAKTLAEMGYTDVLDFGGINDWPYETVSE